MSKGEIARDIGRFTPLEAAEHKLQQVEARIAELTGKIPALREVKPSTPLTLWNLERAELILDVWQTRKAHLEEKIKNLREKTK